ncbi:MAG: hypothetical protein ACK5IJ_05600 [Mangrovibacterium sp.]
MKYLVGTMLLCSLSSCGGKQELLHQSAQFFQEENSERRVFLDSLQVPLPQALLERCAMNDTSVLETKLARSEARILPNGELYHRLEHVALNLEIALPVEETKSEKRMVSEFLNEKKEEETSRGKLKPLIVLLLLFVGAVAAWCVGRKWL